MFNNARKSKKYSKFTTQLVGGIFALILLVVVIGIFVLMILKELEDSYKRICVTTIFTCIAYLYFFFSLALYADADANYSTFHNINYGSGIFLFFWFLIIGVVTFLFSICTFIGYYYSQIIDIDDLMEIFSCFKKSSS